MSLLKNQELSQNNSLANVWPKDMVEIKGATKGKKAAEEEAKKLLSEVKKPKVRHKRYYEKDQFLW